jgi:hypothetical protein
LPPSKHSANKIETESQILLEAVSDKRAINHITSKMVLTPANRVLRTIIAALLTQSLVAAVDLRRDTPPAPATVWTRSGTPDNYTISQVYYADGALYSGGVPPGAGVYFPIRCGQTSYNPPLRISPIACTNANTSESTSATYTLYVDGPMTNSTNKTSIRPVGLELTSALASSPSTRVTDGFWLFAGNTLYWYNNATGILLYQWDLVPVTGKAGVGRIWWSQSMAGRNIDVLLTDRPRG